ncbi:hypothetical protein [Hymenobacter terrenus]|uniref:hypothetical protein n=1 Tax=Hymenobacter terrenus TaxID=1629124 RepID=UPI000619DAF4|nr:hypothetical protein [Hymenobacter terrenus]
MISSADIVCFEETFWDLLAGGHRPAGSPCQVGDAEFGHKMQAILVAHSLDPALVQLSATHLTGLVGLCYGSRCGQPAQYRLAHFPR